MNTIPLTTTTYPPHSAELTTSKVIRGDLFMVNILYKAQSGDNEMGIRIGG